MTQGQRKDAIDRLEVQTMGADRTFQHFFDEQMVSQSSGWSRGWCERMVSAEVCVKRNERMVFFGEGARVTLEYHVATLILMKFVA